MSGAGEPVDFDYSGWGETREVFLAGDGTGAKYRSFEMYDGTPAVEVAAPGENYLFLRENGRIVVYTGDDFYSGGFPDVLSKGVKEEPGIDAEQVKALLAGENSFEPIGEGLPDPE